MASAFHPVIADDGGQGGLQVLITAGPARFVADEPVELGGTDLGPTPHDLVSAGLAACTSQTLRLYAKRKAWPLGPVRVTVTHSRDPALSPPDLFTRVVSLRGPLDDEQRARLLEIAERCPVHLMLTRGASVSTSLSALEG
ncbi:MAG: osmotically inducible protein OsmC [Caulobacteraceae bacterium]|nr:osmotically inducible protein OsmC [Caulobacteraceae bacterium]